jgi:hypothetical protein
MIMRRTLLTNDRNRFFGKYESAIFFGFAYFDLFYQIIATTVILRYLAQKEMQWLAVVPVETSPPHTEPLQEITGWTTGRNNNKEYPDEKHPLLTDERRPEYPTWSSITLI